MKTLKASATLIHAPFNISASLKVIVRILRWNIPRSNATRRNMKRINATHNDIGNSPDLKILSGGAALPFLRLMGQSYWFRCAPH